MYSYDTLSEAIRDLEKRGYTLDFNLAENCIECKAVNVKVKPDFFEIVEVYRFDGMTSTDDESVVYAIQTSDGLKGTLTDAYGTYADSITKEMSKKLRMKR